MSVVKESQQDSSRIVLVQVNPSRIKLAEPVELTIRARSLMGKTLRLPTELDLSPFSELSRSREVESMEEGNLEVFRLKITTYEDVGELTTPAFGLLVEAADGSQATLEVPAMRIEVQSVLEGIEQPRPREVAGPVQVRVYDYRLLAFFGVGIFWLLMALPLRRGLFNWRQPVRLDDLPPSRSAHEIAMERLNHILEDDLLRRGRFREYFFRLSETIREYVGNRYGFFALDLTTQELLEELKKCPKPGLEVGLLNRILEGADQVKFARYHPSDEISFGFMEGAFQLVEQTKLVVEDGERV